MMNLHIRRVAVLLFCALLSPSLKAQELARRLILKDGSYQLATKWEVNGDRVRFFSSERDDWEELPNSLIDWGATNRYTNERKEGKALPEAKEIDKELSEERAAEEAKTPLVAPGLRLPEDGSVLLLDTFQSEPQLVEMQQGAGAVNRNTKTNMLRAAINPISSARQNIELEGTHAIIQSHALLPSIYVNLAANAAARNESEPQGPQKPEQPQQPMDDWERFRIVHVQVKKGVRQIGEVKVSLLGKSTQSQNLVDTTATRLTGGWVKITPVQALDPGEYAVVEMLGKQGINLYVWDFGVDPRAASNAAVIKANSTEK